MNTHYEIQVFSDHRADLGESPLWSPSDGALYWVDITAPKIHRVTLDSGTYASWTLPTEVGSIGLCAGAGLVCATRGGFRHIDLASNRVTLLHDPEPDLPEHRLNDGKVDRRGRFWAGSMQDPGFGPVGRLHVLDAGLGCRTYLDGVRIPNALAWSPDGATMYFADSLSREIQRFDVDATTGEIANGRLFARVAEDVGVPDGATVDAEGCLWSAHMDGWRVTRYDPDGKVERVIDLPVQRVTSCAFGGPDFDILFVTTATRRLTPEQLAEQPLAGAVLAIQGLGVRGLPEPLFAGA